MMKKMIALLMAVTLLLAGCYSDSAEEAVENTRKSQSKKLFNVSTSNFESYINEQSDTAHIIKGTVSQENDGNAVLVHIHSKKDVTVSVTGTMERKSGGDTHLVYVASDGMETEIADNSIERIDSTINILAGESTVRFIGESAVYDFEIEFGLTDGVSYSDL